MTDLPINQILCGDCLTVIKDWPDKCVDIVLTDPPYGANMGYANDVIFNSQFHKAYWAELNRLAKNQILIWWGYNKTIADFLAIVGNPKQIITWCKPNGPMRPNIKTYHFSSEWLFWFCLKDDYYFERPDGENGRDYWRIPVNNGFLREDDWFHPSSKPINLFTKIVKCHTQFNDLILDPFCGSGTTCVAAKMLGRRYIGIDISEEYCKITRQRLEVIDTGVPVKEQKQGQMALWK